MLAALATCGLVSCSGSAMKARAIDGSAGGGGFPGPDEAAAGGGAGGSFGSGGTQGFGATAGSGGIPGTGGMPGTGGTSGSGAAGTSSPGTARGSGGLPGSGGNSGSGGRSATGGVASTGGSPGSGGRIATGGVTGTGGVVSTGGTRSTGGATGTGGVICAGGPLSGGKQYCSYGDGDVGNGYTYRLWAQKPGSSCMTIYGVDAAFSASWTSPGDMLAYVGLSFDGTKTYDQMGTFFSELSFVKTGSSGSGYVGIHGETKDPACEFYIVEDWFGSRQVDGQKVTTITVDGGDYDVYSKQTTSTGGTLLEIFSVRRTARQCGQVSISDHFAGWATAGLKLGKMQAANVYAEATDTGTIDFMAATLTVR